MICIIKVEDSIICISETRQFVHLERRFCQRFPVLREERPASSVPEHGLVLGRTVLRSDATRPGYWQGKGASGETKEERTQ